MHVKRMRKTEGSENEICTTLSFCWVQVNVPMLSKKLFSLWFLFTLHANPLFVVSENNLSFLTVLLCIISQQCGCWFFYCALSGAWKERAFWDSYYCTNERWESNLECGAAGVQQSNMAFFLYALLLFYWHRVSFSGGKYQLASYYSYILQSSIHMRCIYTSF